MFKWCSMIDRLVTVVGCGIFLVLLFGFVCVGVVINLQ